MFLNLHSKNPKRLTLEPNFGRQTYLSHHSLSHLNKEKSYSTASLKDSFRKFKNKSLSHAYSNNAPISQIKSTLESPNDYMSKDRRGPYGSSSLMRNGHQNGLNMKINDFKKSYLNLDSKLNKCSRPKDYFKPIQQTPSNYTSTISYMDVQKRLQQENVRKQLTLLEQIKIIKNQNEILYRQNQELRKQRSIDLELIARQNQIMQKQQELIEADQQAINAKQNYYNHNRQNDHGAYTFSNNLKANNKSPLQCQDCQTKKYQNQTQNQSTQIAMLKMEEENKYLKNELRELVYQCEKYKERLKKAEQKYQKELEQNQKLIGLIYQTDKQKNHQLNFKKQPSRELPLNHRHQKDMFSQNKPISLKREKGRIYYPQSGTGFKSKVNSPKKLGEKCSNTKSAINLLKFSDHISEDYDNFEQMNNQQSWQKKYLSRHENKLGKDRNQKRESQEQMQWCQNQNIRKYLQEINKQKAKEMEKIDFLLSRQ